MSPAGIVIYNPFYLLIFATILEFFMIITYILRFDFPEPRKFSPRKPMTMTFEIVIPILTVYSVITVLAALIDGDPFWFTPTLYLVIPLLLCSVLSIYAIWRAFVFPCWRSLVIHVLDIVYMIGALIWLMGLYKSWFYIFIVFLPVIANPVLDIILRIIPIFRHSTPLWDKRAQLHRWFPLKVHLILFAICVIEWVLQLRGYSLIIWG